MRRRRTALISSAVVALVVTLLGLLGLSAGAFQRLQPRLVDNLFPSVAADPRIALVLIDDKSLAAVGRWPWDRSVHAGLLTKLDEMGAAQVGYDVTFSEPGQEAGDALLAEALGRAGNVVLATGVEYDGPVGEVPAAAVLYPPIDPFLRGALAQGHVSVFPDDDGVVRSLAPVVKAPSGELIPSLSLALVLGEASDVSLAPAGVRTPEGVIPTGAASLMDVNYAQGFDSYSAIDVLEGHVPASALEGRLVLVGASALGLGDYKLTPLDKATGQPGVLVHANALNTMLSGSYLRSESNAMTLLWVFLLALLVAIGITLLPLWLSPAAPVGLGVAFVMVVFARFDAGVVMNLVYPAIALGLSTLGALGARYLTEERERRRVTKVFGRYLSKDVVDEVLAAPAEAVATLDGASPEISVLFADLRGFTRASEDLPPRKVVMALNTFLDAMTRAVIEEQGTVDKFMGDCVMAFWNAPRPEPSHAERAVRAALRMQRYIAEAMQDPEVAALAVRGCGVGIATGEAVVGNIGSAERLDYTVIGDTVNTASRLCGVAEAGDVVVTETCAHATGEAYRVEMLPPVSVKGKDRPLRVYRVVPDDAAQRTRGGRTLDQAAGYSPVEPVPDTATRGS